MAGADKSRTDLFGAPPGALEHIHPGLLKRQNPRTIEAGGRRALPHLQMRAVPDESWPARFRSSVISATRALRRWLSNCRHLALGVPTVDSLLLLSSSAVVRDTYQRIMGSTDSESALSNY
ncbi:hypothetical protein, partial [Immundisolibacter sp.]|uniref:hypothetical protein n=1 Tax=Immundisolibacter sp. TaxID=1934948 RepID=UPI00356740F1